MAYLIVGFWFALFAVMAYGCYLHMESKPLGLISVGGILAIALAGVYELFTAAQ